MKLLLFGATGMVGQGVLREALAAGDVERVLIVVRSPSDVVHAKVEELVHHDFADFSTVAERLTGFDACLYCLGVSVTGMSEANYRRVTHDFALAAATVLASANPGMVFGFVSGAGTDDSEQGRNMWARVKGATENALRRLPFAATYMFRPGYIHPAHGERSKTPSYRLIYAATGWLFPLLRRVFPRLVTTTEEVGRAMLRAVRERPPSRIFENDEIVAYAAGDTLAG